MARAGGERSQFIDVRRRSGARLCRVLLLTIPFAAGCGSSDEAARKEHAAEPAVVETPVPAVPKPVEPSPAEVWEKLILRAKTKLEAQEFDDVRTVLDELGKVHPEGELSDEKSSQLRDLTEELSAARAAKTAAEREAKLAGAQELLGRGKLVEAQAGVDFVLANGPTDEERASAKRLADEIVRIGRAARDLRSYMRMLGSENVSEVRSAKMHLARDPETALSLLMAAVEDVEHPVLVANALDLMNRLGRPRATVPAMVEVLQRPAQQRNWPDAVQALGQSGQPGAGPALLELAATADIPEQRIAALTALGKVVDPPKATLLAVLPQFEQAGPSRVPALRAAYRAVRVHGQFDLVALRGFDADPTSEQARILEALPETLAGIRADAADAESARAATVLAHALGLIEPQVLGGVQVVRGAVETEGSPAGAVLDGVWKSTEPATMWKQPIGTLRTIQFDLGERRTVVGVRIWNLNEPAGAHRGWKDVEVYVGEAATDIGTPSKGVVPMAPGAPDVPDYGVFVPVEAEQGRFVRLQSKSAWRDDDHTGLSEVQILGF